MSTAHLRQAGMNESQLSSYLPSRSESNEWTPYTQAPSSSSQHLQQGQQHHHQQQVDSLQYDQSSGSRTQLQSNGESFSVNPMLLMGGNGADVAPVSMLRDASGDLGRSENAEFVGQGQDSYMLYPPTGDDSLRRTALGDSGLRTSGGLSYSSLDTRYSPTSSRLLHPSSSSSSSSSNVPELSPPSTATFSPTSSSSYSDFISPRSIASQPTPPLSGNPRNLLPPAEIFDDGLKSSQEKSWFGEMQESFLQQQAAQGLSPTTPTQYTTTARHRSPAPSFSPCPSPVNPYSRSGTPNYPSPPQVYASPRRGSVANVVESPTRRPGMGESRGRRQSRLSISVPPYTIPPPSANGSRSAGFAMNSLSSAGNVPIAPNEVPVLPASSEEMDRLMAEIGTMLGPDVMASLESPSHPPPSSPSRSSLAPPFQQRPRPSLVHSHSYSNSNSGTIEMAGVTLTREDLDLLEAPELFDQQPQQRAYPASAPAWKTSFDPSTYQLPPPPLSSQHGFQQQNSYSSNRPIYNNDFYPPSPSYAHEQPASPGFLAPSSVPLRPRSAPGKGPYPQQSYPSQTSPVQTHRRRGSSVDSHAALQATYGNGFSPVTVMVSPSQSYQQGYPQHHQQQTPPQLQHPNSGYMEPSSPTYQQYSPRGTPKTPRTPRRRTQSSPAKKNAKASPGISFINYTATDANVLLSGVAPSGSSKRKREEMEEAAAGKKPEAVVA